MKERGKEAKQKGGEISFSLPRCCGVVIGVKEGYSIDACDRLPPPSLQKEMAGLSRALRFYGTLQTQQVTNKSLASAVAPSPPPLRTEGHPPSSGDARQSSCTDSSYIFKQKCTPSKKEISSILKYFCSIVAFLRTSLLPGYIRKRGLPAATAFLTSKACLFYEVEAILKR